jgi:hypothetical protein
MLPFPRKIGTPLSAETPAPVSTATLVFLLSFSLTKPFFLHQSLNESEQKKEHGRRKKGLSLSINH